MKKVMKFGGTSVAHASNINKVIDIISATLKEPTKTVVVVSALGGITDDLVLLAKLAFQRDPKQETVLKAIRGRHDRAIKELTGSKNPPARANQEKILRKISEQYVELEKILKNISSTRKLSLSDLDAVMSFGERLSSYVIFEAIKNRGIPCEFVDSREVIKTDDNFGNANVNLDKSYKLMSVRFRGKNLFIMGGFIGSTDESITTTLGRGGSDYTASLAGVAVDASVIEIWTDVDGIMTEDPKKMKNALLIPEITYERAEEMAYNGAKVIHPKTIRPAVLKSIPIYVKNTFNPSGRGTRISNEKTE